jgi:hypothetical protein
MLRSRNGVAPAGNARCYDAQNGYNDRRVRCGRKSKSNRARCGTSPCRYGGNAL